MHLSAFRYEGPGVGGQWAVRLKKNGRYYGIQHSKPLATPSAGFRFSFTYSKLLVLFIMARRFSHTGQQCL